MSIDVSEWIMRNEDRPLRVKLRCGVFSANVGKTSPTLTPRASTSAEEPML